ncbi:MAG: site-2 protease family protein [Archangium sp.]|nr:site-2 protease family protein [Archangium sp.]
MSAPDVGRCASCGAQLGPGLVVCPACHRLVHAERLNVLAAQAATAEKSGDMGAALSAWRGAAELLPRGSTQAAQVDAQIDRLSRLVDGPGGAQPGKKGNAAAATGIGAVVLMALSKGKFLLAGLTKLPTLLSMFVAFGAYWALWGWRFALGFVVSIYVHEMGHVAALRRYGISATAPMFIPGLGAFVRLNQRPANAREDATVGLAGPVWGTGAALVCLAVAKGLDAPLWLALAHVGAWINLFNLLPLFTLDGGRAFVALSRGFRFIVAGVLAVGWLVTGEGMLMLIAGVATWRAFNRDAPQQGDVPTVVTYSVVVALLCGVLLLSAGAVPGAS